MSKINLNEKTVLIADDDEDTRNIVSNAISLMGCTTVVARDGEEAWRYCKETVFDAAVLDVMMPGMDGIEVCERIKSMETGEYLPVLILTAKDEVQDKVTALEGGADDYLTKPFHYQELQARVKALIRVRELTMILREQNKTLQALQEKLISQERQLVATQLGGTAAHSLGQPLSAIMLNCNLLEVLGQEDPKYQQALSALKSDARRMAEMIEKLRTVNAEKTEGYFDKMKILDIEDDSSK